MILDVTGITQLVGNVARRHEAVAWPTGQTRYAHDVLRVPAVHKDGRPLSIAFAVGLLYGPQRNVTGILAVIRNETARFAEDRNLRTRLAELEQRERINATETNALEED